MVLFSFSGPVIRTAGDEQAGRNEAFCHRKGNALHGTRREPRNGAGRTLTGRRARPHVEGNGSAGLEGERIAIKREGDGMRSAKETNGARSGGLMWHTEAER